MMNIAKIWVIYFLWAAFVFPHNLNEPNTSADFDFSDKISFYEQEIQKFKAAKGKHKGQGSPFWVERVLQLKQKIHSSPAEYQACLKAFHPLINDKNLSQKVQNLYGELGFDTFFQWPNQLEIKSSLAKIKKTPAGSNEPMAFEEKITEVKELQKFLEELTDFLELEVFEDGPGIPKLEQLVETSKSNLIFDDIERPIGNGFWKNKLLVRKYLILLNKERKKLFFFNDKNAAISFKAKFLDRKINYDSKPIKRFLKRDRLELKQTLSLLGAEFALFIENDAVKASRLYQECFSSPIITVGAFARLRLSEIKSGYFLNYSIEANLDEAQSLLGEIIKNPDYQGLHGYARYKRALINLPKLQTISEQLAYFSEEMADLEGPKGVIDALKGNSIAFTLAEIKLGFFLANPSECRFENIQDFHGALRVLADNISSKTPKKKLVFMAQMIVFAKDNNINIGFEIGFDPIKHFQNLKDFDALHEIYRNFKNTSDSYKDMTELYALLSFKNAPGYLALMDLAQQYLRSNYMASALALLQRAHEYFCGANPDLNFSPTGLIIARIYLDKKNEFYSLDKAIDWYKKILPAKAQAQVLNKYKYMTTLQLYKIFCREQKNPEAQVRIRNFIEEIQVFNPVDLDKYFPEPSSFNAKLEEIAKPSELATDPISGDKEAEGHEEDFLFDLAFAADEEEEPESLSKTLAWTMDEGLLEALIEIKYSTEFSLSDVYKISLALGATVGETKCGQKFEFESGEIFTFHNPHKGNLSRAIVSRKTYWKNWYKIIQNILEEKGHWSAI